MLLLLPKPPVLTPDCVVVEPLDALEVLEVLLEPRQVDGLFQRRELERLVVGTVKEPPET